MSLGRDDDPPPGQADGLSVPRRFWAIAAILVFTLTSIACAFAPSLTTLSIARVIQGLGATAVTSVNAALVRFTYPHRMLGRPIGINAFVIATSAAIGPTIASAILAVARWRWLFAIQVPIGIAAIAIGRRRDPFPTLAAARRGAGTLFRCGRRGRRRSGQPQSPRLASRASRRFFGSRVTLRIAAAHRANTRKLPLHWKFPR